MINTNVQKAGKKLDTEAYRKVFNLFFIGKERWNCTLVKVSRLAADKNGKAYRKTYYSWDIPRSCTCKKDARAYIRGARKIWDMSNPNGTTVSSVEKTRRFNILMSKFGTEGILKIAAGGEASITTYWDGSITVGF